MAGFIHKKEQIYFISDYNWGIYSSNLDRSIAFNATGIVKSRDNNSV